MSFDFVGRLKKLREKLAEEGLEALVMAAVDDEGGSPNIRYLSGFGGTTGVLAVSRNGAALAVDARYTLRAREEVSGVAVVEVSKAAHGDWYLPYVETALGALALPNGSAIGFEGAKISTLMVESLREVKDVEEIAVLRGACARTTEAFVEILPSIAAGMRETDMAVMLDIAIRRHGALKNSFATIIASGPNSASPHHETGERPLEAGESVVIDFGGVYPGGYCSDITRTIFVPGAEPDPEMVRVYRTVLGANRAAREALKVGMMWKDYDAIARAYIMERGYGEYFTHGLGHSVGLDVHDPYDYKNKPFTIGTVMTDEPGIYLPGRGGVRIEDDLVITEKGVEVLNKTPYLDYEPL